MSPEAPSPFPALPEDFLSPGDFPSLGRSEGGTAGLGIAASGWELRRKTIKRGFVVHPQPVPVYPVG